MPKLHPDPLSNWTLHMARRSKAVEEALDRWVAKGFVSPDLAGTLRAEAEVAHQARTRRWGQLLVAILGAVALILAAGLFAERNWEELSRAARSVVLVAGGIVVWLAGVAAFRRSGWETPGALLQAGGQAVLLVGLAYSETAWTSGSPVAIGVGLLALVIAVLLAPVSFGEGLLMAGVQTAATLVYLAIFLERALAMDPDAIVWTLDALILLAIAVQAALMRRWDAARRDRALMAFTTSLWAGLILAVITGFGPLDAGDAGILGMDLWLLVIALLTLWGIHRAPTELRRDAFETNLAICVAVGGLLAMFTLGETFEMGAEGAGAAGAVVGGLGLVYGLRHGATSVLVVGSLTALFATWVFAIGQAGAVGGVIALLISAAVLFWLSTRIRTVDEDREPA
ncbi:MAG TPA: DUF2157 domain-containing protein [Longimicrobiales bacterium]|nr:DUF2157 domain-containing protein [Longimicrobiales bacterium]